MLVESDLIGMDGENDAAKAGNARSISKDRLILRVIVVVATVLLLSLVLE